MANEMVPDRTMELKPRKMAVEAEFEDVCALVNSAYDVETGHSGVAFKKRLRFHDPARSDPRLMRALDDMWVLESQGEIIGCVRWVTTGSGRRSSRVSMTGLHYISGGTVQTNHAQKKFCSKLNFNL